MLQRTGEILKWHTPLTRLSWLIWRYDHDDDEIPDVFGEIEDTPIFVVTAY
jgi:hypothetical protein